MKNKIYGGNVIFVPKAGVFFVDGAVRRPGSYPIMQEIDIMKALVTAGGFQPCANKSRATLIRHLGEASGRSKNLTCKR